MANRQITVVRVYLREGENLLRRIVDYLHDEAKVSGVTVFRGIEGFGEDGTIRTVSLLNLSLDLPLIVEFYDDPAKAVRIIEALVEEMRLPHVVSWSAQLHGQAAASAFTCP